MVEVCPQFAAAVEEWIAAAEANLPTAAALYDKLWFLGKMLYSKDRAATNILINAVNNGTARIVAASAGDSAIVGGSIDIAGSATVVGIGIGLGLSLALLAVVGTGMLIHEKNKRDMNKTRADALVLYRKSYWPRYVRFCAQIMKLHPNKPRPPEPFTFEEFFNFRGDATTVLVKRL